MSHTRDIRALLKAVATASGASDVRVDTYPATSSGLPDAFVIHVNYPADPEHTDAPTDANRLYEILNSREMTDRGTDDDGQPNAPYAMPLGYEMAQRAIPAPSNLHLRATATKKEAPAKASAFDAIRRPLKIKRPIEQAAAQPAAVDTSSIAGPLYLFTSDLLDSQHGESYALLKRLQDYVETKTGTAPVIRYKDLPNSRDFISSGAAGIKQNLRRNFGGTWRVLDDLKAEKKAFHVQAPPGTSDFRALTDYQQITAATLTDQPLAQQLITLVNGMPELSDHAIARLKTDAQGNPIERDGKVELELTLRNPAAFFRVLKEIEPRGNLGDKMRKLLEPKSSELGIY